MTLTTFQPNPTSTPGFPQQKILQNCDFRLVLLSLVPTVVFHIGRCSRSGAREIFCPQGFFQCDSMHAIANLAPFKSKGGNQREDCARQKVAGGANSIPRFHRQTTGGNNDCRDSCHPQGDDSPHKANFSNLFMPFHVKRSRSRRGETRRICH